MNTTLAPYDGLTPATPPIHPVTALVRSGLLDEPMDVVRTRLAQVMTASEHRAFCFGYDLGTEDGPSVDTTFDQVRRQVIAALDAVDRLLGVTPRPRLRLVRGES